MLDRGHDIGQRGEMEHPLDTGEGRRDRGRVVDVGGQQLEAGIVAHAFQVLGRAADQAVERDHFVALGQQQFDQMAADESGAAGNQGFAGLIGHGCLCRGRIFVQG